MANCGSSTFPETGRFISITPFESFNKDIAISKGKEIASGLSTFSPNSNCVITILFFASRFDSSMLYFKSKSNFPPLISLPTNLPEYGVKFLIAILLKIRFISVNSFILLGCKIPVILATPYSSTTPFN